MSAIKRLRSSACYLRSSFLAFMLQRILCKCRGLQTRFQVGITTNTPAFKTEWVWH